MRVWQLLLLKIVCLPCAVVFPAMVQAQDYTYTTNADNITLTITGYTGSGGAVRIPTNIDGLTVTSIGPIAFFACWSLASVTIPDSVTYIGYEAFCECDYLTSVTISDSVTGIGQKAFCLCGSLANITIGSSVTNIGDLAFYECPWLTGVYFRGNAPSASSTAFYLENTPTAYYLPGTTGWSGFSANTGIPTALWLPQMQTGDGSFGVQTNQFGFNINWASGTVVVVEACTNLANFIWFPVQTNTMTGGPTYFRDLQWMNYPARFYRLRAP
jgi:hypothetical protein